MQKILRTEVYEMIMPMLDLLKVDSLYNRIDELPTGDAFKSFSFQLYQREFHNLVNLVDYIYLNINNQTNLDNKFAEIPLELVCMLCQSINKTTKYLSFISFDGVEMSSFANDTVEDTFKFYLTTFLLL